MNLVYQLLPDNIPYEIQDMIYYYIGISTPSANIIRNHAYKEKRKTTTKRLRFAQMTLWSLRFQWKSPTYAYKSMKELTKAETDLRIAYHRLQQDLCLHQMIDVNPLTRFMLNNMIEWHKYNEEQMHELINNKHLV